MPVSVHACYAGERAVDGPLRISAVTRRFVSGSSLRVLPARVVATTGVMAPGRPRRTGWGHGLTPREVQIMDLLGRGYRTREVARALSISERAITAHITKLM